MSDSDPIDELLDEGLAVVFGNASGDRQPPPHAPTRLGDYRILHEIGRGGMGVVYLAEQTSLRRRVALKVLPAHLTLSREAVARFRAEASSAARLRHRGIVRVHAVDEHEGHHFFAMEFVDGSPLHDALRQLGDVAPKERTTVAFARALLATRHRDPEAAAATEGSSPTRRASPPGYVETVSDLVSQVADALQHAHDAGVVHRDVKPSNILVRADGVAVLTDFGLARDLGGEGLTQTGVFAGTPHYASPEQVRGGVHGVDHRSDVFSLGVTLYELLTAQRPFDGATTQEVLRSVEERDPPDPRRFHPRIPRDLVTIVSKALEKDPERRYARAGDFADDLRAFLAHEPIRARPASTATRIARFAARHRSGTAATAIVTVAAAIALVIWLLLPGDLNVVSRPPGATIFVDGRALGTTPLERPLALAPGTYVVHLELPEKGLVGLPQEVTIERSRSSPLLFELWPPDVVLQLAVEGDDSARAWIQDEDPIRPEYTVLRTQKQQELDRRLATGDVDGADGLARELDVLSPSDSAEGDVRACRAQLEAIAEHRREVEAAIDEERFADAESRLRELAGTPFGPANEAFASLRARLADAITAACLAGATTPGDCERPREQLERLDSAHTGITKIEALRTTLETNALMERWYGRALAATSAGEVEGILTGMEARDPRHRRVQEVREVHTSLAARELAEADIERATNTARAAFGKRDLPGVDAARDDLRRRAEAASENPTRQSLENAASDLDTVHVFLADLLAAEDLADHDPTSATARLDALDARSTPAPFGDDAAALLTGARAVVASARARAATRIALDRVEDAVARLDIDAARDARAAIPDPPPDALRAEIDRAARSIDELDRRERDRAAREREFASLRSDVAAGRSHAAEQKLLNLRPGWESELRYVAAAIAHDPNEAFLRRGARLALLLGRADEAESFLSRAIGDRAPSARDLLELGRCRYLRARTTGEEEDLQAAWVRFLFATVLDPADPDARAWRAVATLRLGHTSLALRDLEVTPPTHSAGTIQLLLRVHSRWSQDGSGVASVDPARWEARARDATFTEDDFLARMSAHGTEGLGPELARFRFHLLSDAGIACLRREDWRASRRLLEEALSLDESAAQTRVGYALALAGLGEWSEARSQLARAKRDAGSSWTPELDREIAPILEGPGGGR